MAAYRLRFKRSIAKDLRAIPKKDLGRILKRMESLSVDPRPPGCEKLSGDDRYRIRQGIYRIIYAVIDAETCVVVIKVAHRRDAYQK